MRFRLRTVLVLLGSIAIALTVVLFRSTGDDSPEDVVGTPDPSVPALGIVGALTATAEVRGGGLDPTALATPATESPTVATIVATSGTATPGTPSFDVRLSADSASPGGSIEIFIDNAVKGESFDVSLGGIVLETAGNSADGTGQAVLQLEIPSDAIEGSANVQVDGSQSGTAQAQFTISFNAGTVTLVPEQPGPDDSLTISVEGFHSGEQVAMSIEGEALGGGLAGVDGTFSMTSGLPTGHDGSQVLTVEGDLGSSASAPFRIAAVGGPGSGDEVHVPPDQRSQGEDVAVAASTSLPAWLNIVIGVFAGWALTLTAWLYRVHRLKAEDQMVRHGTEGDLDEFAVGKELVEPGNQRDNDRAA